MDELHLVCHVDCLHAGPPRSRRQRAGRRSRRDFPILDAVRRLAAVLLLALVATACGSDGGSAPLSSRLQTLPRSSLPELDSRARALTAGVLAEDALEPALKDSLESWGYLTGLEREFFGRTTTFDHVVARTLMFETRGGAEAYVDWLGEHADNVLGRAAPAELEPLGDSGVAFTLAGCGTCKKELPTFLVCWRRGATVLSLLASGSGVNAGRFDALARVFDRSVG